MDAWEKFKKSVENNGLVKARDRVLIGVSGGPDSMTLLHLFWRLKKTVPLEILPVYLDHGLRRQSAREAEMVAAWGKKLGVPALVGKIPVRDFARSRKISLETAGRELRYRMFFYLAKEHRCNKIATGHTSNDNAETVLMWLIRGTGTSGLGGIPMVRAAERGTSIIRPMLDITRDEIMAYIRRQKLAFCTDASNRSADFTRNRIRRQLIPLLKRYNPRIVEHLFGLSRIISTENDFLHRRVQAAIRRSAAIKKNRIAVDLKRFFRYNRVIQPRILKEVMPEKRSAAHIERLREWISSPARQEMVFSRSWMVVKNSRQLVFKKRLHNA